MRSPSDCLPILVTCLVALIGHVASALNEDSWEYRHMKGEHHLTMYDDDAFFRIHDLDRTSYWTPDDVTSIYGVTNNKEQDKDVPETKVQEIRDTVFRLIDTNNDMRISRDEWINFKAGGGELPDFGFAGHHEDEETEFDMHHVEIYHSDPNDDDESKWNHPEDIEHFRKHDEKYHSHHDPNDNIPAKYRKQIPVKNHVDLDIKPVNRLRAAAGSGQGHPAHPGHN